MDRPAQIATYTAGIAFIGAWSLFRVETFKQENGS